MTTPAPLSSLPVHLLLAAVLALPLAPWALADDDANAPASPGASSAIMGPAAALALTADLPASGVHGEAFGRMLLQSRGYEPLPGLIPGGTGIDNLGVRRQGGKVVELMVQEVKSSQAAMPGASWLGETKDGLQLSEKWTATRLRDLAGRQGHPAQSAVAEALERGVPVRRELLACELSTGRWRLHPAQADGALLAAAEGGSMRGLARRSGGAGEAWLAADNALRAPTRALADIPESATAAARAGRAATRTTAEGVAEGATVGTARTLSHAGRISVRGGSQGVVRGVGVGLGVGAIAVDVALAGSELAALNAEEAQGRLAADQAEEERLKVAAGHMGGILGATGGAIVGAKVGAVVGTAVEPGIGTTIGGISGSIVGGVAGGMTGDALGRTYGPAVIRRAGVAGEVNRGSKALGEGYQGVKDWMVK